MSRARDTADQINRVNSSAADATAITVDSSENVGIGTSSPTRQLDVSKAGTAYIRASNTANSVNMEMLAASSGGWIGTQTNHSLMFQTNNAERIRIDSDGLKFNADTAAANALDDYEEGTWTPTVTGSSTAGTTAYASQAGYYTKIGRLVNINCLVNWSSMTGAGFMELKGIPYPIANLSPGSQNYPVGAVLPSNVNWTGGTMLVCLGMDGTSTIALYGSSDNGGATRQNCVNESANFRLTLSYMTT